MFKVKFETDSGKKYADIVEQVKKDCEDIMNQKGVMFRKLLKQNIIIFEIERILNWGEREILNLKDHNIIIIELLRAIFNDV